MNERYLICPNCDFQNDIRKVSDSAETHICEMCSKEFDLSEFEVIEKDDGGKKKQPTAPKKASDAPVLTAKKTGQKAPVRAFSKQEFAAKLVGEGFRKKASESNAGFNMKRLQQVVELAVEKNAKLLKCSPKSVQLALMDCVLAGVYPDGKQASLIPYGNDVKLEIMVQGIVKSALRSGVARRIVARAVYENDSIDININAEGEQSFNHKIDIRKPRGELVAAYAIITLSSGEVVTELLRQEDIAECRKAAKSDNVWRMWTGEMARKSAIRRAFKYMPDGDTQFENLRDIELRNEVGQCALSENLN